MPTTLTPTHRASWQRDGFVVLPGFASADETAALRRRASELVGAFEPTPMPSVFSSRDGARLSQRALVESADQVRCFLEEEACGPDGCLLVDKALGVNKIGHALHDRDPVFARFSRSAPLAALASELGFVQPRLMQSMLIFKQPRIGGEVVWHQDASFLISEPASVVGFWWALEDATLDNGCLWVAPGGHRGPLRERFVRRDDRFVTERLDDTPWPSGDAVTALEVGAGTLVVFDGMLPHASAPNRSARSRLAYTLHLVEAAAAWSPLNWLQRSANDPARGFESD